MFARGSTHRVCCLDGNRLLPNQIPTYIAVKIKELFIGEKVKREIKRNLWVEVAGQWRRAGGYSHRRMRRGGGAAALPNSGKTVAKIRAKQEEKIDQRKLKD